jgi:ribosomal-protein-alanine N-acetyltransferase
MAVVLETDRLTIREMTIGDTDFVSELLTDTEVMRHYVRPYTHAESAAWLVRQVRDYGRHGYGFWLFTTRGTSDALGLVGILMRKVDGVEEPEVGYMVHKRFWRSGLATEAALAARNYAFSQLRFDRVIALIRPENVPAQGVATKLNMKPEKRTIFNEIEYLVYSVSRDA